MAQLVTTSLVILVTYGEVTNALFALRWLRRAYQVEAYFSPYTGMGGLRVRS